MRTLNEIKSDIEEARTTNQDWESVLQPLLAEQSAFIRQNRDFRQDAVYFKLIDCPVHLTHKVKLYSHPHRFAGIWECFITEESDLCPHFDLQPEDTLDGSIDVCVLCSVQVEDREPEEFDCV